MIIANAGTHASMLSVLHGADGGQARNATLYWLPPKPETQWIFDRIAQQVHAWNNGFGFELQPLPTALQLTHYLPGQKYDWHMDLGDGLASLRKVSIVCALNDGYEGGGVEIFYGETNPQPPLTTGEAILFPSYTMHRALTVRAGERWSLVAWFDGTEPFK